MLPCGLGAVAWAGPRAQPSDPPARATEQGRPAAGPLAVRQKPRQRYPTARRPLGARTLRRNGSCRPLGESHRHPPVRTGSARELPGTSLGGGANPPVPRVANLSGARGHPAGESAPGDAGPKRSAGNSEGHGGEAHCGVAGGGVCGGSARGRTTPHAATRGTGGLKVPSQRPLFSRGGRNPPGGCQRPSLRRPRGPRRADPGRGVGDVVLLRTPRAPPRAALLGRGRRSLGAPRAGANNRREAARPRGNIEKTRKKGCGAEPRGRAGAKQPNARPRPQVGAA